MLLKHTIRFIAKRIGKYFGLKEYEEKHAFEIVHRTIFNHIMCLFCILRLQPTEPFSLVYDE